MGNSREDTVGRPPSTNQLTALTIRLVHQDGYLPVDPSLIDQLAVNIV